MDTNISFTLKVWRQNGPTAEGHFDTFEMKDIPGDTSFLEMLDILNEQLIEANKEPFVFDHDCREGICGMCALHQWSSSRTCSGSYYLPALYASFPRW